VGEVSVCFLKIFWNGTMAASIKRRVWISIVKSLTWKIDPNKCKEKLWDSWSKIFVYNASCDELFHTVSRVFKEQGRCSKLSLDLIKQSQKATAWRNINKSCSNRVNFQNVLCWTASFLARMAIVILFKFCYTKRLHCRQQHWRHASHGKYRARQDIRNRSSAAIGGYVTKYLVANVKYWKL
jgi:hypothetical protein